MTEEAPTEVPPPEGAPQGLADDFYYDLATFHTGEEPPPEQLPPDQLAIHHSFGFDADKRYNIHYADDNTVLCAAGNTTQLLDVNTGSKKYMHGFDKGGVGAIAVHPNRRIFAVAEKGTMPNIYLFEFPSLRLYRVLRNGTEKAYSDITFSSEGSKLASVGASPDFMLTVWDWKSEQVILRSKAFSQEVFRVQFSPVNDGVLISSGTGHIKFWHMARTFTGLKLQGEVGKFGKVEISDVACYIELPNGKVLSGAESGALLLWDGNLIQFEVTRAENRPCHRGMIEVLFFKDGRITSAGVDGYIRVWDYSVLENADINDSRRLVMEPLEEITIAAGVQIKGMIPGSDHWLVQDGGGALWKVDPVSHKNAKLLSFHAGAITGMDTCPIDHVVATAGADGTVRLFDYVKSVEVFRHQFDRGASALVWAPEGVDLSARSVAVGFGDGVVRILMRCSDGWTVAATFKPHQHRIVHIAYSPDGKWFCTAAEDKAVFVFKTGTPYEPIGFVPMPAVPTSMVFRPSSDAVMLTFLTGDVMEMALPDQKPDSMTTYELNNVQLRTMEFIRPPTPEPPPEEKEEGEEAKEGEEGAEGQPNEPAPDEPVKFEVDEQGQLILPAAPTEASEEAAKEAAKKKEEEEAAKQKALEEESDHSPTPVLGLVFLTPATFIVSRGGRDVGRLYECEFTRPDPIQIYASQKAPVQSLRLSRSGKLFITGCADGSVRVSETNELGKYSCNYVHDSNRGGVRTACSSFDDSFVLTAGSDGTFFSLKRGGLEPAPVSIPALPTTLQQTTTTQPLDTVFRHGGVEYSIQQARLKTEEDKRITSAEDKKSRVRMEIAKVKLAFHEALEENQKAPKTERLTREEFLIDPELADMLAEEISEKERMARKEMEWVSEKKRLMLAKMRARFLDDVLVPRICVAALKQNFYVSTFRLARLPPVLEEHIKTVRAQLDAKAEKDAIAAAESRRVHQERMDAANGGGITPFSDASADPGRALRTTNTEKKLSKLEQRRIKRERWAKQWDELMRQKPPPDYVHPRDLENIEQADKTLGDYKLKSSADYVVPEDQRIDAQRKFQQMVLLQEEIHNIKNGFNKRLLALRQKKRQLVERIRKENGQVRSINQVLNVREQLFQPTIDVQSEFPEENVYSDKDVMLSAQKRQATVAKLAARMGRRKLSGMAGQQTQEEEDVEGSMVRQRKDPYARTSVNTIAPSVMENEELEARQTKARFDKQQILVLQESLVEAFDEELAALRREKFRIEGYCKVGEMKMLTLYQEFVLLKEFEKQDLELQKVLDAKRAERDKLEAKMADCMARVTEKEADLEKIPKPDALLNELHTLTADMPSAISEALKKLYNKNVARVKKKAGDAKRGGSDSDSDSDAESSDEDEDEGGGDDKEPDACPPGCSDEVYRKVLALREQHLDAVDDANAILDAIKKITADYNVLEKQKSGDNELDAALAAIQKFQREKQESLNKLDVTVTLTLDQIQYILDGQLPQDLSQALMFTTGALARLKSRAAELRTELGVLEKEKMELDRTVTKLGKEKKAKEAKITELKARAMDVQMLKFGKQVDLDTLLSMSVNRTAEELKTRLTDDDAVRGTEIEQFQAEIDAEKDKLTTLTRENTEKLNKLASLSTSQQYLEKELNLTQTTLVVGEFSAVHKQKEQDEMRNLERLIEMQNQELEALRNEIRIFSLKGGVAFGT